MPTIYKTITSITSKQIQKYTDDRSLMTKDRKGTVEDQKDAKISY